MNNKGTVDIHRIIISINHLSILLSFISGYIEIVPQSQVRVKSFQNFFLINLCNDNKELAAANQQKRLDNGGVMW